MKVICKICSQELKNNIGLVAHINKLHHLPSKDYYDRYLKKENDGVCCVCKKDTSFINITKGYRVACSSKCSGNNKERLKKIKNTCIVRYGHSCSLLSEEIKEKSKKTLLTHYGVDNPMHSDIIKERLKQSVFKKYGTENVFASKHGKTKIKETLTLKYGVENPSQLPLFITKKKTTRLTNLEIKNKKIRDFENSNDCTYIVSLIKEYGNSWENYVLTEKIKDNNDNVYVKNECISNIISFVKENEHLNNFELGVVKFLQSLNIANIITNDRELIKPKELDIYIPNNRLAIECNGLYWHSENVRQHKTRHLDKTEECLGKGLKLIHLNEWEWLNKQDICKSIIKNALGIYGRKIYARKCEIKEVSIKDANEFLEENHVQGKCISSYRLGLYYKNELVQLITLSKSRFKVGEIELVRMCTKNDTKVMGGFSRLMTHQPFNDVVSYIDRSKFTGESYYINGWKLLTFTPPNYSYFKYNIKLSRQVCQKHKLQKLLGDKFDRNLTETENMMNNNYYKLYDCGNIKVKWKR